MTHQWYAMYLSAFGHFEESIAQAKMAETLDPLSLSRINNVAIQLYHAHKFEQALLQVKKVLEMDPNYPRGIRILSQIYLAKSMYEEAILQCEKYLTISEGSSLALAFLGYAYGTAGKKEQARHILYDLNVRSEKEYVSAFEIALVYMGLGNNQLTLKWLDKAYLERSDWLVHMNVTPIFDTIRSDHRFVELVKKMKLEIIEE